MTARGPARPQDPETLFKDAQEAFGEGLYQEAADRLQRLADRHGGFGKDVEVRGLLGQSLLRLGRFAEAIAPLRGYLEAQTKLGTEAQHTRLTLARAYIGAGKYTEALLSCREALDARRPPGGQPAVGTEALMLQGKAQLGLHKTDRAELAAASAHREWNKLPDSEKSARGSLAGELAWTDLEIQIRKCEAEDPSKSAKKVAEDVVLAAMDRWGGCLAEAALAFRAALATDDADWTHEAGVSLVQGYRHFGQACANPPPKPGKKPTPDEGLRYREELSAELRRRCGKRVDEVRGTLESWRKGETEGHRTRIDEVLTGLKDGYATAD
ncbi:MAG TPA: tetratricopeptide repeat protein [Bdellovibrionota bacterium]|nr:tetratricopeptide repeat protein [Bdellovibrionota bacterium]